MGRRRTVLGLMALVLALPAASQATIPEQTVSRLFAEGRGFDQATNPDYLQRTLPSALAYLDGSDTETVVHDPFRFDWAPGRGEHRQVEYRNRYGARIVADLYAPLRPFRDPVTGQSTSGPFPGLVLVPGAGTPGTAYEGVAESLAEAGYVVLTFDPQGQGRSDIQPSPEFCQPGPWQQPQEGGLVEHGDCAGVPPPITYTDPLAPLASAAAGTPLEGVLSIAGFLLQLQTDRPGALADIARAYELFGPNYTFGALDAFDYFVSGANPLRSLVDATRVGVLGHSLGAYGAATAANGDPRHRFVASAAFDGYTQKIGDPTTPTLFIAAENLNTDFPIVPEPDPDTFHPWVANGARWRASTVDTLQISLRASSHNEWYYLPLALANPVIGPLINSSSLGERVSVYYLQAWFDLQLKGAVAGAPDWAAQRADAMRRIKAETFDASVDGSSIGQGRFDPLTQKNRSYTLDGLRTADNLSRLFRSAYDIAAERCDDMVASC